ncbi:hypothetical protein [uncultured Phenylobacterium sp.]|uniref:hypothetical protein n=1 Tax=uncultured Phenylobacterium sp. TaxID=349273 RepID=UPI0025E74AB1|nr:hypothetical protein [uncultured Phenylobacterium sp.]
MTAWRPTRIDLLVPGGARSGRGRAPPRHERGFMPGRNDHDNDKAATIGGAREAAEPCQRLHGLLARRQRGIPDRAEQPQSP